MVSVGPGGAEGGHALLKSGARQRHGWTDDPDTSISYEILKGSVALITLRRPEARNAWTELMRNEVARAVDRASRDPAVRAIVLTGDPAGRAFCAGADLNPAGPANPSSMEGDVPEGRDANLQYWRDGGGTAGLAIMRSTKPVIAAINGAAVGVGMTLALCCDMSIAAEDAKCGFVFGKRGLTMECLSSNLLERCIGHKKAMELVLTGRVFRSQEAPPGLFNYVVPAAEVVGKALDIAAEIADTSPMSTMLNRQMIIRNAQLSPEEAHLVESRSIFWVSRNLDAKEGIASFLEKRPPAWKLDPFKDSPDWFPWWLEYATKAKL